MFLICFQDTFSSKTSVSGAYIFRESNMGIQVVNLHKDGEGSVPNPVLTFEHAFAHHREYKTPS